MAEENHDGIAEMLLPLQDSDKSDDQFLNPKPDINLQLSLGGFYDKNPSPAPALATSFANPGKSVLKRSYFGKNEFMQKEVAEIKITREVHVIPEMKNKDGGSSETSENQKQNEVKTSVSSLDIPVWAAQSASGNPAFQRALNVIRSEGSLYRAPRTTDSRVYTSSQPHAIQGFASQISSLYQALKTRKSIATHVNYRTNQRSLLPRKQPENLNLVAPATFSGLRGTGIPHQQLQQVGLVSPFNYSLASMAQLPRWNTDEGFNMHPKAATYAPSSSGSKISYPFPPFLPISSRANGNSYSFMSRQPTQHLAGSVVTPIPMAGVMSNGSRVYHNSPMYPPEYPCKRARHDHNSGTGEAELELMKQFPIVVTTGGKPNGKKIEGLLYKYGGNQEVIIICVCHGCFFSPEEFVRHAGGGDVENPRQEISVLPYPDYLRNLDHHSSM